MRIVKTLLLACATSLAIGGAGLAEDAPEGFEGDPRLGERVDRICFAQTIDGFRDPTDTTVVIEARVNDFYLVETQGVCRDLRWAKSIAMNQSTSFCVRTHDTLTPSTSFIGTRGVGGAAFPCRINAIYEWSPDAGETEEAEDRPAETD